MNNFFYANTAINLLGFPRGLQQKDVSFFNFSTCSDSPVGVNYDLIVKGKQEGDLICKKLYLYLDAFMIEILGASIHDDNGKFSRLMIGIGEHNNMFMGMSSGSPGGNSVGNVTAEALYRSLSFLRDAAKQGNFTPNVFLLGVDGIGPDRCSDVIVSVGMKVFLEYTQSIIDRYHLSSKSFRVRIYDIETRKWIYVDANLPELGGCGVVFTPKNIISELKSQNNSSKRLISFIFREFLKGNDEEWDVDSTIKGLRRKMKEKDTATKQFVRDMIQRIPNLVNLFEDISSQKIDVLSDSQLEQITQRVSLKCAA